MAVIALAHLAAIGQGDRIASATVTNTLVDFSIPGDLGVFTDEDTIARLEHRIRERGYLDSKDMARTFDWMRSRDLIWSYVINNWFKGKQPPGSIFSLGITTRRTCPSKCIRSISARATSTTRS